MAISFTYDVCRMDGTMHKAFKNQAKAEAYAMSLKQNPSDKIQITRTGKNYAPYTYYL